MKKILVLMVFAVSYVVTVAQTVKGKVTDGNNNPIEFANIVLSHANDSSFVSGTTSGKDGGYVLHATNNGEYLLRVSSVGYKSVIKKVTLYRMSSVYNENIIY